MDIIVENISYVYKRKLYIKNASFEMREGKVCGIIGNEYACILKMLEIMSGNIKPKSGSMYLLSMNDRDKYIKTVNAIGYCTKKFKINESLKINDYLRLKGKKYLKNEIELDKRIEQVLEFLAIKDSTKHIKDLFYIDKFKINLAAELIKDPKILILDLFAIELNVLDKQKIIDIINNLKGSMTIVFGTNDLNDINSVCDKVIIFKDNCIKYNNNLKNAKEHKYLKTINLKIAGNTNLMNFIKKIESFEWVSKITGGINGSLKIYVTEFNKPNAIIPKIITSQNLDLIEYRNNNNFLEDIYFDLMN